MKFVSKNEETKYNNKHKGPIPDEHKKKLINSKTRRQKKKLEEISKEKKGKN